MLSLHYRKKENKEKWKFYPTLKQTNSVRNLGISVTLNPVPNSVKHFGATRYQQTISGIPILSLMTFGKIEGVVGRLL